ncbi:TPA: hypothetical protein KR431_003914, partial [Clostridioides difficile]|nr:hypothetical protein [Clostridioides difficile]
MLPVIYEPKLPVIRNSGSLTVIDKKPIINKKIKKVNWKDFFCIQTNDMKVYRIIPHANVTNNNKRLWRAIHKMYEMYEKKDSRLERNGLKFTYREKDYFWFDVLFKQEKGQKKIEFYVSTTEYQADKLKRKLDNKLSVTFKEADISDLHIPSDNTIVQELRYLNHDIFSLNTAANESQTPINSILAVVDGLNFDGDIARLSICNEAENRQKWIMNAQWAHEKLQNRKVP